MQQYQGARYYIGLRLDSVRKLGPETEQLAERLATGWTVRGSNPGRCEILRTHSDPPLPGVKRLGRDANSMEQSPS